MQKKDSIQSICMIYNDMIFMLHSYIICLVVGSNQNTYLGYSLRVFAKSYFKYNLQK